MSPPNPRRQIVRLVLLVGFLARLMDRLAQQYANDQAVGTERPKPPVDAPHPGAENDLTAPFVLSEADRIEDQMRRIERCDD